MLNYVIINGVSTLDMDIYVLKHPLIIKAERESEDIKIPGKHGILHEIGTYKNYTKSVELLMNDTDRLQEFLDLIEGPLEVVFSHELDYKYRCRVKNQIDLAKVLEHRRSIILQLDTHPFKFSANPLDDEITATSAITFHNKGTFESEPIIEVYGSGNVTLTINNKPYILKNVSGSVTVNSEMMEVYKGIENKNNTFEADEFPNLNTGENTIRWSGNVSKVLIQPNWRWL